MHLKTYLAATGFTSVFVFALFILSPILAPYMNSAGLNEFQIGLIMSISGIVIFFTAPILGRVSDKIGRRAVMFLGLMSALVGFIFYILDTNWINFLVARGFLAISFVAIVIVGLAKIEDVIDEKRRGEFSGMSLSLMDAMKAVAPPLGGLLADHYFVKLPFLVSIIIVVLLFLFIYFWKRDVLRPKLSKGDVNLFGLLRGFVANRRLRWMAFLGMAMHSTIPIYLMFIPLLVKVTWGMPYSYVGYALFAFTVPHLFQFALGKFADRVGEAKAVVMGTILCGLTILFMSKVTSYVELIIMIALWGVWSSLWNVSAWAFMSDIGEKTHDEGTIVGSYISWAKVGSFVSWVGGGFFVMHYGLSAYMMLIGSLILVVSIISYPLLAKA
ncbi:MAG: MFS transporter [Candidatus Nanoarchaeia archaeon]